MKVLGLDLGISSVGSALVDFDSNNLGNTNILHSNIRIFETPEKKEGSKRVSLQKIRGEKRRARNNFDIM
jgi:CRISPR/Cas system Type II protein with McrA/HNH and RuvC-like nuclease domain